MRTKTMLLSLAIGAVLSMGGTGHARAAGPVPSPIAVGQQVRGEITSADLLNWRDGSRSELFAVDLAAGQGVRFVVEGPLRAQLSLFVDGQLLQSSSSSDDASASLGVRASRAGRHVLAVSGRDASAYGPFTLGSSELQVYAGGELVPGASITDWIDGSRRIPLRIERDGVYSVRMASDEFDTLLALEGNGVSLGNDDADGSNSALTARLAAGTYTLLAGGFGGEAKGPYTLSVAERELPAGVAVAADGDIEPGRDITALYQGQAVAYRLRVPARQLLELGMRSSELDSKLALEGTGVRMEDDDSGGGRDARLVTVLEPGDYTVRASAYDAGVGAGVFTLAARLSDAPADVGGGVLQPGQRREARLLAGMTDRYTFRVQRAGSHVIEMASDDGVDGYLRLRRGGELVAEDDDGGGGFDARIEQSLPVGEYTLEASSAVGGEGGRYRIGVQRR